MKLYYGTYGHHLSGKLYVYWGGDNFRTGQQVVAPVTNKRSGKTYNTMFTIARTQSEKNAQPEVERLEGAGITIKSLGGTDVLTLPGGKEFGTKKAWKTESEGRYRKKYNLDREVNVKPQAPPQERQEIQEEPQQTLVSAQNKRNSKRSIIAEKKRARIRKIPVMSNTVKNKATQKAKSALIARKNTAGDTSKAKQRLKEMKGREAFIK